MCPDCHHRPSGRFNADGYQCHCDCHDHADRAAELAPALLAALEAAEPILSAYIPAELFDGHAAKACRMVRAAIEAAHARPA